MWVSQAAGAEVPGGEVEGGQSKRAAGDDSERHRDIQGHAEQRGDSQGHGEPFGDTRGDGLEEDAEVPEAVGMRSGHRGTAEQGCEGTRKRKGWDTEVLGSPLVTTPRDLQVQNSGHRKPETTKQSTGIWGRGCREPWSVGRGHRRHPAAQDGLSGEIRWAEQGEARKREAGEIKELARGDKGHSGFRENAVRVRGSAEGWPGSVSRPG